MKSKFYYKKKSYALNRLLYNGKYLQKGEAQSKSNVLQCGTKKSFCGHFDLQANSSISKAYLCFCCCLR